GAGPRVVEGGVTVGREVSVGVRVAAVEAVVRRIVPARSTHRPAPGDHHAGVAGGGGKHHPVVVALFDRDVGDVARRRTGRDLVDRLWHRAGDFPRTRRALA